MSPAAPTRTNIVPRRENRDFETLAEDERRNRRVPIGTPTLFVAAFYQISLAPLGIQIGSLKCHHGIEHLHEKKS